MEEERVWAWGCGDGEGVGGGGGHGGATAVRRPSGGGGHLAGKSQLAMAGSASEWIQDAPTNTHGLTGDFGHRFFSF